MFKPQFTLTPEILSCLMRLERLREEIRHLPITPLMLASMRESAKLESIHFSTQIEGNRLTQEQVIDLIKHHKQLPGRERDQFEVWDYLAGLDAVEKYAESGKPLTEEFIQKLHALVMAHGKKKIKPTAYRDGQNVIRDSTTGKIVYLPPEAHDVSGLMSDFVAWLRDAEEKGLPEPLIASIAHYQFATIHPYYDGNGRTARLIVTLLLQRGGYGLQGIYSHEECYAKNLPAYYQALDVGGHHNYYMRRETEDITRTIAYFCTCLVESFEKVKAHAEAALSVGSAQKTLQLRALDPRQRKALSLFENSLFITAKDIEKLFNVHPRTARMICQLWVKGGFLVVHDASKKSRNYKLAPAYESLL